MPQVEVEVASPPRVVLIPAVEEVEQLTITQMEPPVVRESL
jgi:hypothetical protein